MAFPQFHRQQYVRILDTNTKAAGGYIDLTTNMEISQAVVPIYINGAISGSEQLRMNLYSSSTTTVPTYSSDWFSLSDIGAYSPNWIGNIFFNFDDEPVNAGINYYFDIQPQNYTRNGLTFYIGVILDWYSVVNTQVDANSAGFRASILGLV